MVKISITVGKQLISIEKKEWLCHGVSQPGHKVSLLEIPCCTKQQAEKNIYRNSGLGGFERLREKAETELNQFKNITCFCARRPREEGQ